MSNSNALRGSLRAASGILWSIPRRYMAHVDASVLSLQWWFNYFFCLLIVACSCGGRLFFPWYAPSVVLPSCSLAGRSRQMMLHSLVKVPVPVPMMVEAECAVVGILCGRAHRRGHGSRVAAGKMRGYQHPNPWLASLTVLTMLAMAAHRSLWWCLDHLAGRHGGDRL